MQQKAHASACPYNNVPITALPKNEQRLGELVNSVPFPLCRAGTSTIKKMKDQQNQASKAQFNDLPAII